MSIKVQPVINNGRPNEMSQFSDMSNTMKFTENIKFPTYMSTSSTLPRDLEIVLLFSFSVTDVGLTLPNPNFP